jgi:hypothetical protein
MPDVDCDGAVDAYRTMMLDLLGNARRDVRIEELCGCWALLALVHVENEAVAVERGARMAGG